MNTDSNRDFGLQPLDGLMTALELANNDLVAASTEQLTHKMVAKGRRGRWLSVAVRRPGRRLTGSWPPAALKG